MSRRGVPLEKAERFLSDHLETLSLYEETKSTRPRSQTRRTRSREPEGVPEHEDNASDEEDAVAPAQKEEVLEDQPIDMRTVYPVDDDDPASVLEMAKLSVYMHNMGLSSTGQTQGRAFTVSELMGLMSTWFNVGTALARINDQEYRTQRMEYTDGVVTCTCYIFEILQRLHETAYAVFRAAIEHLRTAFIHTETYSLLPPATTGDAFETATASDLKIWLLMVAEFCRDALNEFHPVWKDFNHAATTNQPEDVRNYILACYSARHTGTLGTLATHLLQIIAAVKHWKEDEDQPHSETLEMAWESLRVIHQIRDSAIDATLVDRFPYDSLKEQLRYICYLRLAKQAKLPTAQRWNHATWLYYHVWVMARQDNAMSKAYHECKANETACKMKPLSKDSMEALEGLDARVAATKAITAAQIVVMDPAALSTVYRERIYDVHTGRLAITLRKKVRVKLRVI